MANHLEYVRRQIDTPPLVALMVTNQAVVLTADEIVTGRAGLFGFGNRLTRYPLATLRDVQLIPNPSASLLRLFFADHDEPLTLMFPQHVRPEVDRILAALEPHRAASARA